MRTTTTIAGQVPALTTTITTQTVTTGEIAMNLLHEALSRVRMQSPQAGDTRTEATRSARTIAMQARQRWARELGGR
ncbi:hypothetical protein O7632_27165 [Solwaraspora sp. WMMD406]|uniref:hypothetical protein n=1 Tax=Solwaraspora sp. WMMD406 TaxID=3016095 RepID=UPI0024178AF3|nr:hypothetical protein [Solwaraspora sp. WMMD406]MDG4767746.1 hypothetical protein [Solwaraspora sp. WMMD406]